MARNSTLLSVTGVSLHARSTPFHATSETSDTTFDRLYREHAARVMGWAARLGGPGIDVDDVTQEVFLVVHRRLDTLRPDVKPTTWLFGITANVLKTLSEKQRQVFVLFELEGLSTEQVADVSDTTLVA